MPWTVASASASRRKIAQGQRPLPVAQPAAGEDRFHVGQKAMRVVLGRVDVNLRRGETAFANFFDLQPDRQAERIEAGRMASASTPASMRAASVMSPLMPLKQSK